MHCIKEFLTGIAATLFAAAGAGALAFTAMFDREAEFANCPVLHGDI